jgi:hypothetical protein
MVYIKPKFSVALLFLWLTYLSLQRYHLHVIMIMALGRHFEHGLVRRPVLLSGSGMVLWHAHFLHWRWVHDGHRHGTVVRRQPAPPLAVLLAVGAPVQAAVGHARVAGGVLLGTKKKKKVDKRLIEKQATAGKEI